ncbi:MAG: 23S rRNA (guanosine(2251)-2'-O)-methyltransferase RlmB [Alphaproteobacteria bacterium]
MAKRKSHTTHRRGARPAAAIWLYGVHAVRHALANRARRCRQLLLTAEAERGLGAIFAHAMAAAERPTPITTVERAAIEARLPAGATHQGVALEADPLEAVGLDEFRRRVAARKSVVALALDRVSDPRNVGAVLRAAAAFDAAGLILTERHAPPATGALAKAAAGALEHVPLVRVTNLARALRQLQEDGFWCLGLDATAGEKMHAAELSGKCLLVLGAEGAGLRRLTRESCDGLLRISAGGKVESLNVAAAAAIALYEWSRQN